MVVQSKFFPRQYQLPILEALDNGIKRAVWCAHRRSGKDMTILNWVIKELIVKPQTCFYILPAYSQAKKIIWDSLNNDGQRVLDYFPKEFVLSKNSQQMQIRFRNGSLFQLIGSDNIDSLMGTNPKIVVFSEYALQNPSAWQFLSPILKVNGGTAVFISTPRGKNHFYELYNYAKSSPDWFCQQLTIDDTDVLTKEDVDKEIEEGMSEEIAYQEYYVSFDRGAEGSYYGKYIQQARNDGRIGIVSIDVTKPVHTSWDIGVGDSSALFFFQEIGTQLHFIYYYECHGVGLEHYTKYLDKFKDQHSCIYGTHFVPHDMRNTDFGNGLRRIDVARSLGYEMKVVSRFGVDEGIQMVRSMLSRCHFDEKNCKRGIECLDFYRKKWNDHLKVYLDTPLHDQYSHGADAMRYAAQGLAEFGTATSNKLPVDYAQKMAQKYNTNYAQYAQRPGQM